MAHRRRPRGVPAGRVPQAGGARGLHAKRRRPLTQRPISHSAFRERGRGAARRPSLLARPTLAAIGAQEDEGPLGRRLEAQLGYRAESALLGRVGPLLARDGEEGRAFLKALFATPADLVPNDTELLVRFHSMAQPRLNRALRALCEATNDERQLYPGTSLRMVFEGPRCLIEN